MTDLRTIAARVKYELDHYEVPIRHPELVGSPLPASRYEDGLAAMRQGLVEPYWAKVIDYDASAEKPFKRDVIIVARDQHENYLAYDPQPAETQFENDFAMVGTEADGLHIYNVRGDAVGCYLSF